MESNSNIFKLDLSTASDLTKVAGFKLISYASEFLSLFWLGLIIGIKHYVTTIPLTANNSKAIADLLSIQQSTWIFYASVVGVLFSLICMQGLIKTYFSNRLSHFVPKVILKSPIKDFPYWYASLKAPDLLPKGIDTLLAFGTGLFGFCLLIFLILINQEDGGIITYAYFSMYIALIFYSLMRSIQITFNYFSMIGLLILVSILFLPAYLFNTDIVSNKTASFLIETMPLCVMLILPFIQKKLRNVA